MYRSRLILAACVAASAFACKSNDKAPPAAANKASAATKAKVAKLLAEVPRDRIYAASAHVRVVDAASGQVVAGIDLQRSITAIAFSNDGMRGYVAASDGVREIDPETNTVTRQLTTSPARHVSLSSDGSKLFVLEHDVIVREGGVRDVQPFRLATLDVVKGIVIGKQTIGHRVLTVVPSTSSKRHHLVVFQNGEMRLSLPSEDPDSMATGRKLDLMARFEGDRMFGVRPYVATSPDGARAYVPLEGEPSRVAEVDLDGGHVRVLELGKRYRLRGLAVTPDARTLVVNASSVALKLDLASGEVTGKVELAGAHLDAAMAVDGRRVYLARPVDDEGGAITVVRLEPMKVQGSIHLDDISPWVLTVRPRAALASR